METISQVAQTVALIIGAAWALFNFDLAERSKTQHVELDLEVEEVGTKAFGDGEMTYVVYSTSIRNQSETTVDFAGVHIIFTGLRPQIVTEFNSSFSQVVHPALAFNQSDFVSQVAENGAIELGQSVKFPGYRLNPGEAVAEDSVFFLFADEQAPGVAVVDIFATAVGVNPCTRSWLFFSTCERDLHLLEVSRHQSEPEICDPRFRRPAPGAPEAANCLRLVRANDGKTIASEEATQPNILLFTATDQVPLLSDNIN